MESGKEPKTQAGSIEIDAKQEKKNQEVIHYLTEDELKSFDQPYETYFEKLPQADLPLDINKMDVLAWAMTQPMTKEVMAKFGQLLKGLKNGTIPLESVQAQFDKKSDLGVPAIWYMCRNVGDPFVFFVYFWHLKLITAEQFAICDRINGTNALFWLYDNPLFDVKFLNALQKIGFLTHQTLAARLHFDAKEQKAGDIGPSKLADLKKYNNKNLVEIMIDGIFNASNEKQFFSNWSKLMALLTMDKKPFPTLITADLIPENLAAEIYKERIGMGAHYLLGGKYHALWENKEYAKYHILTCVMALNMIVAAKNRTLAPPGVHLVSPDDGAIGKFIRSMVDILKSVIQMPIQGAVRMPDKTIGKKDIGIYSLSDALFDTIFLNEILPLVAPDCFKKDWDTKDPSYPDANQTITDLIECRFFKLYVKHVLLPGAKQILKDECTEAFANDLREDLRKYLLKNVEGGFVLATKENLDNIKELIVNALQTFFKDFPNAQMTRETQVLIKDEIRQNIPKLCEDKIVNIIKKHLKITKGEKKEMKQDVRLFQKASEATLAPTVTDAPPKPDERGPKASE